MLINQTNKLEYMNKLENENMLLREENKRLKQTFLPACDKYNVSLLQKDKIIERLERELQLSKQHNAMLVLMS